MNGVVPWLARCGATGPGPVPLNCRISLATSDYKGAHHVRTVLPLNTSSTEGKLEAFQQVSLPKWAPLEDTKSYSMYDEDDPDAALVIDVSRRVEISQLRYAIINFPHPLLKEGLVIIDKPSLNAIGTELEMTCNMIKHVHAALFILVANTGVTKSDIDVWCPSYR